jgi:hypothetical protein
VTLHELELYERCPRRYFYTHDLGLAGTRRSTPFSRTQDCVYGLVRWWTKRREAGAPPPSAEEVQAELARLWREKGPAGHALEGAYGELARGLAATLARIGATGEPRAVESVVLELAGARVLVEPDDVVEADGRVVLRRVRTGKARRDGDEGIGAALWQLAAEQRWGERGGVEVAHLRDESTARVSLTPRKLRGSREKLEAMLAALAAGRYAARPEPVRCARCPHLFGCGRVPAGRL